MSPHTSHSQAQHSLDSRSRSQQRAHESSTPNSDAPVSTPPTSWWRAPGRTFLVCATIGAVALGGTFAAHTAYRHTFGADFSHGADTQASPVTISELPQSDIMAQTVKGDLPVTIIPSTEWENANVTSISFDGRGASTNSNHVTITDSTTTITAAGVYRLTGRYSGQVIVDAPQDARVMLIFDNVHIDTTTGSAIEFRSAQDGVIVVNGNNSIADATSYTNSSAPNAAIYADTDLQISGSGHLTVNGRGNDAISSTDTLVIDGAAIEIEAVDDGVRGKDTLAVLSGQLNVHSQGDALKSDNETDGTAGNIFIAGGTHVIEAGDDAVHAESFLSVSGGSTTVTSAVEGLEAAVVSISGGELALKTSDDAINGSSDTQDVYVEISGGSITLDTEGDGIDANGTLTVSGGEITAWGPSDNGNGTIDADAGFTLSGGRLIAPGSAGMAMVPSSNDIGWVGGNVSAAKGSQVTVAQGDRIITSFTAQKNFQHLLVADPSINVGQTVSVTVNGESRTFTANKGSNAGPGGMGTPPEMRKTR